MLNLVTDRTGAFSPLKSALLAGLLAPALWLLWRAGAGDLGPLPVKELLHQSGDWAVRFLVMVLALTPLQRALAWPKLALVRRMAGVGSFCYALAHFTLYVAMNKFELGFVAGEIVGRIYLTIGFVALLGFAALAATSTDAMLRKLGPNWKRLHKLVHVIAGLALLHYFLQSKIDVSAAVLWAGLYLALVLCRVALFWRKPLIAPMLAALAVAAGALTAILEGLWYGLATSVDPWRVVKANAMLTHGLRPAVIVVLVALAAAAIVQARAMAIAGPWKGLRSDMARTRQAPVARP